MTKSEREIVEAMRSDVIRLEKELTGYREEYGRYHDALEELMRDVMLDLCVSYNHPTSIASGRLIDAVAKASRAIHTHPESR